MKLCGAQFGIVILRLEIVNQFPALSLAGHQNANDPPATVTITLGPCGSIVEAGGCKVLRILAQLWARRARGRGLQVAEMAK